MELGGLWDLPILIMDALPPSEAEFMLRAFCKTAPTKVLLTGADLLLTTSFRGGLGGLFGHKSGRAGPPGATPKRPLRPQVVAVFFQGTHTTRSSTA